MSKRDKPQPKVLGQEDVKRWLLDFQQAVNDADGVELDKLFHAKTIAFEFGTQCIPSSHRNFSFLMSDAKVIPAPGMFVVAIKSLAVRKIIGSEPEFGQATFVLCNFEGKLLGVHSHVSPTVG